MHDDEPLEDCQVPCSQKVQTELPSLEKVPGAQTLHFEAKNVFENVPGEQRGHSRPLIYEPGVQYPLGREVGWPDGREVGTAE